MFLSFLKLSSCDLCYSRHVSERTTTPQLTHGLVSSAELWCWASKCLGHVFRAIQNNSINIENKILLLFKHMKWITHHIVEKEEYCWYYCCWASLGLWAASCWPLVTAEQNLSLYIFSHRIQVRHTRESYILSRMLNDGSQVQNSSIKATDRLSQEAGAWASKGEVVLVLLRLSIRSFIAFYSSSRSVGRHYQCKPDRSEGQHMDRAIGKCIYKLLF